MNQCEHCLESYLPGTTSGQKQRFCTETCRKAAEGARRREKQRRWEDKRYTEETGLSPLEARCPTCSRIFSRYSDPDQRTGWRKYCSQDCRPKPAKREKTALLLTCSHCEEPFTSTRKRKYCSKGCRAASAGKRRFRGHAITEEEFNRLLEDQGGLCKICGDSCSLCIDHDHESGKVRGLLCQTCNSGLGMFKDNLAHLSRAIEYLRDS